MPNQIRYYLKETTNQILVSGSADAGEMNALLTSSKNPNTAFDANTTAKISSLGTAVSYVVQNGTADGTVIPIADNQELWVYRGYQTAGIGDANAYKYNPHLHRPYKAYILTETGSGIPVEPWLPAGIPYEGSFTGNSQGPLGQQGFFGSPLCSEPTVRHHATPNCGCYVCRTWHYQPTRPGSATGTAV